MAIYPNNTLYPSGTLYPGGSPEVPSDYDHTRPPLDGIVASYVLDGESDAVASGTTIDYISGGVVVEVATDGVES